MDGLWLAVLSVISLVLMMATRLYRPLVFLLCFTFGLLYALAFCQYQLSQQLRQTGDALITVKIDSLPKYTADKLSFIGQDMDSNKRYLLSWYAQAGQSPPKLSLHQLYQVQVYLKPPNGNVNGVGFDREKWLFRQGIDGIGSIKSLTATKQTQHSIKTFINQWRTSLSELINQHFDQPRVNALIHALSIGDKSHFNPSDRQTFQNTGTAHLIAISGLHIGMVALLGWILGGLIYNFSSQQYLAKPIIQLMIGLIFAVFYAGLAGMAVSTQRALIMLTVLGCLKLFRRPAYAWDVWSISLLLVLLLDPLNVLDGGFWLSFVAVAVLILAFNGHRTQSNRLLSFIRMQTTLLIGMLPLSLVVFSRLNLIAPAVNLLMIPLMTFLLIPSLLLLLLIGSAFDTFPSALVSLIQGISQVFIMTLDGFNQLSWLALHTSVVYWWQFMLLILGSLWLLVPRAVPQRYWGLLMIALAWYNPSERPPHGYFKAYFLDVGQGLSVVIQTQNHQLIYDVGSAFDSGFNMADAVVTPFLRQQQMSEIQALVLSHQDNDHSGGVKQLLQQTKVAKTWGTESHHQPCLAGETWTWDGVKFSFLSPYNLSPYLKNNSSCVLKIEALSTSLLLTGDIESAVEYRLQQINPTVIQADVLLVPHHGSKTSSSLGFLATVNPKLAINSAGQYNPFNHPVDEVVKRYQQLNIPIIDTRHSGLITLDTHPNLKTQQYRLDYPRIWRQKKPD